MEAIVADRPVIFGPHMENFAALARTLVAAGGALQPNDEAALTNTLGALLRNPGDRERLVRHARAVLDTHRGATERTAALLEKLTCARGLKSLASEMTAPDIGRSPDPIVQWPRTPPFHGGNTGSNPVRVASLVPAAMASTSSRANQFCIQLF